MNKRFLKMTAIGLVLLIGLSSGASETSEVPGSSQDPLVTLSYVESRLEALQIELESQIATQSTQTTSSAVFEVVEVQAGEYVYFGESTEVILRAGIASTIASENGGLADLTTGVDLRMGDAVPENHHLLVARNDGRGMKIDSQVFLLIKGPYTVTK